MKYLNVKNCPDFFEEKFIKSNKLPFYLLGDILSNAIEAHHNEVREFRIYLDEYQLEKSRLKELR